MRFPAVTATLENSARSLDLMPALWPCVGGTDKFDMERKAMLHENLVK